MKIIHTLTEGKSRISKYIRILLIFFVLCFPLLSIIFGYIYNEFFLKDSKEIILVQQINIFLICIIFISNLLISSIYYLLSFIGLAFVPITIFFYKIGTTASLYDSNLIEFIIIMPHTIGEVYVCYQILYLNYISIKNGWVRKDTILLTKYKKYYLVSILVLFISSIVETYLSPYLVGKFLGG